MLPIERIFVPLQHGSKDRRDIGLPAVASRQRLAGRVFREERGQREHIRQSPLFEAGGDSSREEVPDIRFPSRALMAASGLVEVSDIHHGSHPDVGSIWQYFLCRRVWSLNYLPYGLFNNLEIVFGEGIFIEFPTSFLSYVF